MRAWVRSLFWLTGVGFLVVAAARALRGTDIVRLPPAPVLVGTGLLAAVALLCAARAWSALLSGLAPERALRDGFIAAQVGKYIPGGVWLGAGQLGFAVDAGVPAARAAGALTVYAVCLCAGAGGLVALLGLVAPVGPEWLTRAAPLGLLPVALLDRGWMAGAARRLGRWIPAVQGPAIGPQRDIVRAFAWVVAALLLAALTFAFLLAGVGASTPTAYAMSAFMVAWAAGFLVPGLPSGIGVREAALVALLPAPAGAVLAASLAQRLVQMAAEALLVILTRLPQIGLPPSRIHPLFRRES